MTYIDSAQQSPDAYFTPGGPARITVRPRPPAKGDPFADDLDEAPGQPATSAKSTGDPFAGDHDQPPPPQRQTSALEALGGSVAQGLTANFAPALEGVAAASGKPAPTTPEERASADAAKRPIQGLVNLLSGFLSGHPDPAVQDAYTRGREEAQGNLKLAQEQHPEIYLAGQLAGSMMLPIPGAAGMRAGTMGARALAGARAGAIGGGLFGAGEATSAGESLPDIAKGAAVGGTIGAGLGGTLGAAIGPRAAMTGATPGERAAMTAERLGQPLPRGLASDSGALNSTTSAVASVPIVGSRIKSTVSNLAEKAGDAAQQSGAQDAINANKARINNLYNEVRGQIDPDQVLPMPQTAAAVQRVKARRAAARQPNPSQGLEQFENIGQQGASFNGAHRARVDAREAGDPRNPHPGYNAADYNEITKAMSGDIRVNIARQGGKRALDAFNRAEKKFGPIAEANRHLEKIVRTGETETLADLGFNNATGHFSFKTFVTKWNKIKPESRPFLPTPAHAQNIKDIFEMGQHIKGALQDINTSRTANVLMLFDLARDAAELGAGVALGLVSAGSVLGGAAAAAPAVVFMHWLASPARAASMSRWSRAYLALGVSPTPARTAAFNIATRNLANTLGVPVENVLRLTQSRQNNYGGYGQQ